MASTAGGFLLGFGLCAFLASIGGYIVARATARIAKGTSDVRAKEIKR
jgi:hypothetical protein